MKTDQRVSLVDLDGYEIGVTGTIAGMGHMLDVGVTRPIYIIKLDNGFYDPTGMTYISTMVVDRQALKAILE